MAKIAATLIFQKYFASVNFCATENTKRGSSDKSAHVQHLHTATYFYATLDGGGVWHPSPRFDSISLTDSRPRCTFPSLHPVATAVSTCNSGFFASILPNCSIYIFLARTRGECTKNARPSWRVFVWLLFFLRLNRLQSNVVRCVVCASVLCCWLRAFVFSPSFFIFTKLYLSLSEVFVALLAGQFYAFYIRLYFVCFVTIVQLLNFIFIRYTRPSK